jgi:predicted flap endonuclease-1-like 5' DNA nuclease
MARTPSNKRPAPRPQTQQAAASASPRRAAGPSPTEADPAFPFARTAEDDELRDMSGYGWGV